MENRREKTCLCALNRIFGFNPKIAMALIEHLGSARRVFELTQSELEDITGPYSRIKGRIHSGAPEQAEAELESLAGMDIRFCGITEEEYPPLLKECPDPPVGIYVRSQTALSELWIPKGIAVVGTRDVSPYGKDWCRKIVRGLAMTGQNTSIISGLALGVDIEAHRTAVESGLPTIAVMATGPESVYPYRHQKFAESLVKTPGCALITDFPPGTPPLAVHFLRRNRIIAGLAGSTILIESKIRGGGLMTSNLAFSYSRDVYALPGRADDLRSAGCNELIRQKVAEPITSVGTLLDSMGLKISGKQSLGNWRERLESTYRNRLSDLETRQMEHLVTSIQKHNGITLEELAESSGIPYRKTSEAAHMLEIDGFISIDLLQRCCINSKFM